MANILIGTPTTGDVKKDFCESLFWLHRELLVAGHQVDLLFSKGSDIIRQRNAIASRFMEAEKFTHLLFVDSDMEFDPRLVLRMLQMTRPFVGAIYPQKHIDLEGLVRLARSSDAPTNKLVAKSQRYNLRSERAKSDVVDGAIQVDGIGMGLALIARRVFTTIVKNGGAKIKRKDDRTASDGLKEGLYNFFDLVYLGDEYLFEDFSFCHRWRQCDGEIWAVIDSDVGHVGDVRFGGSFLNSR